MNPQDFSRHLRCLPWLERYGAQRWVSNNSISRTGAHELSELKDLQIFEGEGEGEFPGKRLGADESRSKSCFDSRRLNRSTIGRLVGPKIRWSAGQDPSGRT